MKRNVLIRISAIFVLVWYSLGIIGFNVHTCNARERSFIVTFLEDMSCESIHPSDHCGAEQTCCCCCSHHTAEQHSDSDESIDEPECCTDEYQVITSMTDRVDDSKRFQFSDLKPHCLILSDPLDAMSTLHYHGSSSDFLSRSCHDSRGIRVLCNVWRI